LDSSHLNRLIDRKIPVVVVDRRVEGLDVDSVYCDSIDGAQKAVSHLISLGHRRIAVISGPENTSTAEDRILGYRMAFEQAGLPVDPGWIKRGEYRAASGEAITHQILNEGLRPTAIFSVNNSIAIGVMKALDRRGLRIPQDIALVCFDDLPTLSAVFPFLTVVEQPAYEIGTCAAQLLLSRLDGGENIPSRHVVLPTQLIVRYSCGSQGATLSLPLRQHAAGPR
jgi:LacI family transcriptional regulator